MTTVKPQPVVVTTEHRGVFFGFHRGDISLHPADSNSVTLTNAQMCVYWHEEVKGVLGLAATGPTRRCKVTPPVPSITLTGVTSVMAATIEAVTAWQGRPWS